MFTLPVVALGIVRQLPVAVLNTARARPLRKIDSTLTVSSEIAATAPRIFRDETIITKGIAVKNIVWSGVGALAVFLVVPATSRSVDAQGNTPKDYEAPKVFQAAGPNGASILGTIEQFRIALGGQNNANAAGPLAEGRREINWDGGGAATSLAESSFAGFLNNRGALFVTPGTGFVQAPGSGLATTFANLTYETAFQPFSAQRLFSPIGDNVTDVQFFVPGTAGATVARTLGFGAVFSDLDQPDGSGPEGKRGNRGASTLVLYYDAYGQLLFSGYAPAAPGDGGFSFFGVVFADARIARVRIITGDLAPGPDDDASRDIVMMDDFIYGEPQP